MFGRRYLYPRIALDGTRLALYSPDQDNDIWLWDFARPGLMRVTTDPGHDVYPVWTPNGPRLIFASEHAGPRNLFSQAADGSGIVEQLTDGPNAQNPTAITPDGTRLLFTETAPKTGEDVMQLQLDGTHRVTPLVQTPFTERNGIVLTKWAVARVRGKPLALEIHVEPFPADGRHWQVSIGGGTSPLWARSGQELFYVAPSGALMRVGVERSPTWVATVPAKLIGEGYLTLLGARSYDISPDGQRFLMIKPSPGSDQATAPRGILVVQNWGEELKRLVPTK